MSELIKPSKLGDLFCIAQGCGAWQHFNYYLGTYTTRPLISGEDDTNNESALFCMVHKDAIAKQLAQDIFGIEL